jgi:spoIIIJ-associated protein
MADKAEEIERNVHLDPMSAYERRIIHSALQNRTLVETESMGEGETRHVVIKFKR